MDSLKERLNDVISSWLQLTREWQEADLYDAGRLKEGYPFEKEYMEVLFDLMEWRDSLDQD